MVNSMLAAQPMTGADGIRAFGSPDDRVVEVLRKCNRMRFEPTERDADLVPTEERLGRRLAARFITHCADRATY